MGYLKLRRIVYQNFRTFVGTHEVQFPEHGLVIVKGENLDTRGQSGAGKSNLLVAIPYLMGFSPWSAADLKSWQTDEPMQVTGYFDSAEGAVELRRGKITSIKVGDQPIIRGSVKAVNERLDQLVGASSSLVELMTYRDQKKPARFLGLDDKEVKGVLTRVIGLEQFDSILEDADFRVQASKKHSERMREALDRAVHEAVVRESEVPQELVDNGEKDRLILDIQKAQEDLRESMQKRQAALAADEDARAWLARTVQPLREELRDLTSQGVVFDSAPSLVATKLAKCKKHLDVAKMSDDTSRRLHDQEVSEARKKLVLVRSLASKVVVLQSRREALVREIAAMRLSTCDTCKQPWVAAADLLSQREGLLAEIDGALREAGQAAEQVPLLEQEVARVYSPDPLLAKLEVVHSQLTSELEVEKRTKRLEQEAAQARIDRRIAEKRMAISDLEGSVVFEAPAAQARVEKLQAHVQQLEARLALTEQVSKISRDHREQALQAAVKARTVRDAAKEAYENAARDEAAESDYKDMVTGFRAKVFDEVLRSIGDETTKVLSMLPNAQHISVRFDSDRQLQNGNTRLEIKPVVTIHGQERPLLAATSGGQATSLALAADLALARVASARRGCNLGWMVFDESFEGHDLVTKESCLEVLQEYARDKLIIVVDHASEFKEQFDQSIVVEYQDGKSRIRSEREAKGE